MPLNRKYPIAELLDACKRYLAHAPRDFITFEYCMLDGVNDSASMPAQLVGLVRDARRVVQVQPDPVQPVPGVRAAALADARVLAFAKVLTGAGIVTTVRKTRGDDIDAACGQLAGDVQRPHPCGGTHGAAPHGDAAPGVRVRAAATTTEEH